MSSKTVFELSSINCINKSSNRFGIESKVYDEECKYLDNLLETGSNKKKHNSIRSVKAMMINPDPNELSDKQRDILTAIKDSWSNPSVASPSENEIAAVLFDMKALGDITQFEYFIENLDLFESFETHDTILLLLAIICIGEKHAHLKTKFNKFNKTKTATTFLYFATNFIRSGEKVPLYYKLSIDDLKTIYDKICELLKLTPELSSIDSKIIFLLLKVFARILDSCHDFLKDKTKEEEDEDDVELLTIEHYLNSIFEPAD